MNRSSLAANAALTALAFCAATQVSASDAAVFPGNEAVSVGANGERVIEAPPLSRDLARSLKEGRRLERPTGNRLVYMIEGPGALLECDLPVLRSDSCTASTLGQRKIGRYWTVKQGGQWVHCTTRAADRKCEPVAAGSPGNLPAIE